MEPTVMLFTLINRFARCETGAVTVDFVVLTAVTVGMGMGVVALIAPGLNPAMSGVDPAMEAAPLLGSTLISAD